jgi:thiamine kinase-like enzyme
MVPPLSSLPCFTQVNLIETITTGLSSLCYRVHADNTIFFAKQVTENESIVSLLSAKSNISPTVIYHDQHWLISQFIEGDNLSLEQHPLNEKISIAMKLMSQCHKLSTKTIMLDPSLSLHPKMLVYNLIDEIYLSTKQLIAIPALQESTLIGIANHIFTLIPPMTNKVCCHGDINFSNILLSAEKRAYLIDYECACIAPAEYDLAMFIAVNNLEKEHILPSVQQYTAHALVNINLPLLKHYLTYCYFLNGLWYIDAYQKSALPSFLCLAKQQWQNIHTVALVNVAINHLP